jgi:hypothetical protein
MVVIVVGSIISSGAQGGHDGAVRKSSAQKCAHQRDSTEPFGGHTLRAMNEHNNAAGTQPDPGVTDKPRGFPSYAVCIVAACIVGLIVLSVAVFCVLAKTG